MMLELLTRRLFQSSALVVGTLVFAHVATAAEFTISTPTTVTNGAAGNVLDGDDTLTITGSGSVTIAGANAVTATGVNNTITNAGTISATGDNARGIDADNNNTITNTGSISTNGLDAYGIYALDNNTVTNTGTISTIGITAYGIHVHDNSTVINSGTISTTGDGADGIYADDDSTITNSGSISTTGYGAYGIYGYDRNTITNTGTISTTNEDAYGISVFDNNIITNSGTITTTGENADGIDSENGNTVTNTGTITTSGFRADGIDIGNNNIVSNSGSITTTNARADGFEIDNGNMLNNTGTISTAGINADGVDARDNNTITNSGSIVSAQANSFILNNNNTLNLLAPSFIGGGFNLGTNTTLNITTGPSQSVLWQFNTGQLTGVAPTISGAVPSFFNAATGQFATFDPTAFSVAPDALADKSGLISNVMQQRLERGGDAYGNTIIPAGGNDATAAARAWVSLLGSYAEYDGSNATLDSTLTNVGIVGGYDGSFSGDLKLGVLAGYLVGKLDADTRFVNSFDNKSTSFFAGFYGRKTMASAFFDFAVTGGVSDNTDKRLVNDNLAPLGISGARGEYNGYWISPEIALGAKYDTGYNGWIATPTARLRYAAQWLDGYTETGPSAANAVVGSRKVAVGEASLELAATRKVDRLTTTVRAGYIYRKSLGDNSISVTLIGQTVAIPAFDEDRSIGFVGGSAIYEVSDLINLELGGRVIFGEDVTGLQGNIKLVSKF